MQAFTFFLSSNRAWMNLFVVSTVLNRQAGVCSQPTLRFFNHPSFTCYCLFIHVCGNVYVCIHFVLHLQLPWGWHFLILIAACGSWCFLLYSAVSICIVGWSWTVIRDPTFHLWCVLDSLHACWPLSIATVFAQEREVCFYLFESLMEALWGDGITLSLTETLYFIWLDMSEEL